MGRIRFFKIFVVLFFFSYTVYAQQVELIKIGDIHPIMADIFGQHVDKKAMTGDILRSSFKNYLDQFDPNRVYLLAHEVRPFLEPTEAELSGYLAMYEKGDYTPFHKMDQLIQKAIHRAQQFRLGLIKDKKTLFDARLFDQYTNWNVLPTYASKKSELYDRIRQDLVGFIQYQKDRYGEDEVNTKQDFVLKKYENNRREWEDSYLFLAQDGKPLSQEEADNVFALHVLKSIARSLDSHTSFFDASEAQDMKTRLQKGYEGTGVVFEEGIDGVVVKNLIPGSPAALSGKIKIGDVLKSVDGKAIADDTFQKVMQKLEGDEGSEVKLSFQKPIGGADYQVDLKRALIVLDEDRVKIGYVQLGDGIIGKITLPSFYQSEGGISSEKDVKAAIEELRKQGPLRGLILDLRENSGGYLSQAVKVAGLFITNGVIVISKYSDGEKHTYRDVDGKTWYDGPLVVLTSRLTASAAEIVAQALQDYGVAVIVGDDRTFGKGSIQSQTVTQGGTPSLFKVTVGLYYTVSGKTPQKQGVRSDIVVPGEYEYQDIGEKYLDETLTGDSVKPEFQDDLIDVRPDAKGWFERYYMPTLQTKKTVWQKMMPALKEHSAARIGAELKVGKGLSNDQQMREAVNIIKDMIQLRMAENEHKLGVYD